MSRGVSPFAMEPKHIGWVDEFGNLFPKAAWKPAKLHQEPWRPVFDLVDGPNSLVTEQQRGAIAYELTRRLVIDMPTARAAVDAALKT